MDLPCVSSLINIIHLTIAVGHAGRSSQLQDGGQITSRSKADETLAIVILRSSPHNISKDTLPITPMHELDPSRHIDG